MSTKKVAQLLVGALLIIFAIASATIYYYFGVEDIKISALKDIVFFGVSIAVSYFIARMISREDYNSELQKLGDLSSRRIYRLTVNLRQIARSISNGGVTASVASELKRLAEDADQSALDISLITGIKESIQSDVIYCPRCGSKDKVDLPASRGSTEMITCSDCRSRFHIHRVDNGVKIVLAASNQIVGHADGGTSTENLLMSPHNPASHVEISCPNPQCSNKIRIIDRGNKNISRVYCTECFASMSFNFSDRTVSAHTIVPPHHLILTDSGYSNCASCSEPFDMGRLFLKDRKGNRFGFCQTCSAPQVLSSSA